MTEQGTVVGLPVCKALKKALGDHDVACQGVKYSAGVTGNMMPGGDPVGVNKMKDQVAKAAKDCPQSHVSPISHCSLATLALSFSEPPPFGHSFISFFSFRRLGPRPK